MKLQTIAASLVLALLPALFAVAQSEPGRLPAANYGSSLVEAGYVSHSPYHGSPLADCQCDNRKGYDLWCQPASFSLSRRSKLSCGCGVPAPSCCAPEPICSAPAPTCCAPAPTCAAPEPACCAPEPTCCAPEPTCGAPMADCCDPCRRRGLLSCCNNPFADLHAKLATIFKRKKTCCPSDCCCDPCGSSYPAAPTYMEPSVPQELPESIDNPFLDDPAISIPVPNTTTSNSSRRHGVMQVHYQE